MIERLRPPVAYGVACLSLAGAFLVLGFPNSEWYPEADRTAQRLMGTVLLGALSVLWACALFRAGKRLPAPLTRRVGSAVLVAISMVVLFGYTIDRMVDQLLRIPIDAYRADMLVVIEESLKQFTAGQNPYQMYRVPWPVPLPYGPGLWLPFVVPFSLGIDLRYLSILGSLVIPIAAATVLVQDAACGRWWRTVVLGFLLVTMVTSPVLLGFLPAAHTPAYWPLLLAFTWFFARRKIVVASVLLGLMLAARTTMVVLVPVFLIHLWLRHRKSFLPGAGAVGAAAMLPFLPFAVTDPKGLWHCMVVDYVERVKPFVWSRPEWLDDTFGLTAWLVRNGWEVVLAPVQIGLLAIVYLVSIRFASRAMGALVLMVLALLAFSTTVFWPVHYLHLDVLMLASCVLLVAPKAEEASGKVQAQWVGIGMVVAVLVTAALTIVRTKPVSMIDIGTTDARHRLYKGFSVDEVWPSAEGDRTAAWATSREAWILLPRASRAPAKLKITLHPFMPDPGEPQNVVVDLNGASLGQVELAPGWQELTFEAPRSAWRYGNNVLRLRFAYARSPYEVGLSDDQRKLAVAVDRIEVEA